MLKYTKVKNNYQGSATMRHYRLLCAYRCGDRVYLHKHWRGSYARKDKSISGKKLSLSL
jgi:hypothetical protein